MKLVITPVDNGPFGRITVLFSGVRIMVLKIPSSCTTPALPCASIISPTLNGRKIMSITPPARLPKEPFSAAPIPTAAPASIAEKPIILTPSIPAIDRNNTSSKLTLTSDNRKVDREASNFRCAMARRNREIKRLIIH
ncbi:hypothetical protein FQZ97_852010 [compost metagenome]